MKTSITAILMYFAVAVWNSSDAYFYADTNSIAPVAYYSEDSLPKRIGHENPVSSIAAISAIAAPIIGWTGRGLGFNPAPLTLILLILGVVGGIIGLTVRKELMVFKYASYPKPKKLRLGQWRSLVGIFGSVLVSALIATVLSCG